MSSFVNKGSAPKPKGAGRRRALPPPATVLGTRASPRISAEPATNNQKDFTAAEAKEAEKTVRTSPTRVASQENAEFLEPPAKRKRLDAAGEDTVREQASTVEATQTPRIKESTHGRPVQPQAVSQGAETDRPVNSLRPAVSITSESATRRQSPNLGLLSNLRHNVPSDQDVPARNTSRNNAQAVQHEPLDTAVQADVASYEVTGTTARMQPQVNVLGERVLDGTMTSRGVKRARPREKPAMAPEDMQLSMGGMLTPANMATARTRKVRKDKGTKRKRPEQEGNDGRLVPAKSNSKHASGSPAEAVSAAERSYARLSNARKKRMKATSNGTVLENGTSAQGGETEPVLQSVEQPGGEQLNTAPQPAQKRSRKRPRGEEQLGVGESIMLDTSAISMHTISRRNIGTGEKSEREKAMEHIDWNAVKISRREEARRLALTRGKIAIEDENEENRDRREGDDESDEEDLDAQLARAVNRGPRKKAKIIAYKDGMQVFEEETNRVDRDQLADEEVVLDEHMEDDLTRRVNSHSYQALRRRDPAERVRNYDRWTSVMTDRFYECLSRFGPDFMIISAMIPGRTRREIKAKYVREGRANPTRVDSALKQAALPHPDNWDLEYYKAHAQLDDDSLRTPQELNAELNKLKEENRAIVAEAKRSRDDEKRQKELAGFEESDEDAGEATRQRVRGGREKEGREAQRGNQPEKVKKRKLGKRHDVGFTGVEESVEVLGEVHD